jgi:hypothetical protein
MFGSALLLVALAGRDARLCASRHLDSQLKNFYSAEVINSRRWQVVGWPALTPPEASCSLSGRRRSGCESHVSEEFNVPGDVSVNNEALAYELLELSDTVSTIFLGEVQRPVCPRER